MKEQAMLLAVSLTLTASTLILFSVAVVEFRKVKRIRRELELLRNEMEEELETAVTTRYRKPSTITLVRRDLSN